MQQQWKKQFVTLWTGQAVSIFTSAIVQMALIWYITDKTDSAAMLVLATLVGFLPRAIIGIVGGVYIDRHSKKAIMICADAFIAILSLLLVLVGELVEIPLWLIFVVLFGRSLGASMHEPSLQSVTPLIVPKEKLVQYAGYAQGFQSVSDLLSPAAAAALYAALPLHRLILIDVVGAAFAIIMLCFVKIESAQSLPTKEKQRFLPELKAGLSALKDAKGMRMLMGVSAAYSLIYAPVGTLFPLVAMSHFAAGVQGTAVVETVFAAGALAGSLLLGALGGKIKHMGAIGASIAVYGLGTLVTGLLPRSGFYGFVVAAAFMGASIPFYHGVRNAMLQLRFPQEMLGRIMALSMSVIRFTMPIGLVLAGAFAEVIGVGTWFAVSGVLALALAGLTWVVSARQGEE